MPELVLVDGYNLIRQSGAFSDLAEADLGAARQQLVDRLCNYAGFTGAEVWAVFDAYRVKGRGPREDDFHGVRVIYTEKDETADAFIERASREAGKRRVRVVSSDAQVQQISLGHGALRASSREFLEEMSACEEAIRAVLDGQR